MPGTFTFDEAAAPAAAAASPGPAKTFAFEDAGGFSFEEAHAAAPVPARDTSRDSYEAQLADLGLTEADAAEVTKQSDKQADLLAAQRQAARQGEYQQGVINRIDALTGNVVEPLTRPLSGVVGRTADVLNNAVLPENLRGPLIEQALQRPVIDLPRAGEAETTGGKVVAGTYNAAADLLASLSSPDVLAMLPAAANKAVLTAWIAQMAGHAPERVLKATQLFKEGKTQQAVQEVAVGVGELGLAELGRRQVMGPGEGIRARDVEGEPRLNINDRGEVVDRPLPEPKVVELSYPPLIRRPILNEAGEVVDVRNGPTTVTFQTQLEWDAFRNWQTRTRQAERLASRAAVEQGLTPTEEPAAPSEPAVGQYPAEGTPRGRLTPEQQQAALDQLKGPKPKQRPPAPEPLPELHPTTAKLIDAIVSVANQKRPQVGDAYGALEAVPTAKRILENQIARVEQAGGQAADTKPLYDTLGTIEHFENTYLETVTRPPVQRGRARTAEVLPPGGLVSGTAAEGWADRTIAEGGQRLFTGLDPELFAAYVVKGAAHLERGVRAFGKWSEKMIAEFGDAIRPHLRRIFAEAQTGLGKVKEDAGALKQRKLAARGSVSPEVAGAHRERLKTGREAFYEPQDMGRVEDAVSHMTSDELAGVPVMRPDGANNLWTAAQLELYRRNVAAGNLEAAWSVMEQAMKTGTSMGQLINQFKMLRGATPDGVLVAINRRLAQAGFDPMRPSEQLRTRQLAEESIKANAKWKEAERIYRQDPSAGNFERTRAAREDAIDADVDLQRKVAAYHPRALGDMLITLLKGNLLAPISQAANIAGNTTNLLIRGGARSASSVVDAIDSFVRGRRRQAATVPLRGAKEAVKGVVRSVPESVRQLWKGSSDGELSKADVQRGLRPLVALRDLFRSQVEGPQRNGKTPFGQRLLLALEASPFAMHATAQLRLLGAVDKPFRAAARARLITEAVKLADLNRPKGAPRLYTPENVARAVEYPELFLDAPTLARVDGEASYAVYQGRNPLASAVHLAMRHASPSARFFVASVAPYITTPTNLIGEWMSYNPAIAGLQTVRQAMKGNARGAQVAAGKFVAGSMMLAAGLWLYRKGLISPSLDQQDEQQKARVMAGMTMPPHHINLSGLERALKGGNPAWRPGDKSADVLRAGGVAGALMMSATDVMRQRETQPEAGGLDFLGRVAGDQWTQMLQYGVNQSFLRGTANLLDAIQEGKMDTWAATYVDTLTSIPLPGTLNSLGRQARDYKPEVRGDALDERLENQLRARLGVFGAGQDLPYKRDLWGRPIRETPEGRTPWIYQNLDVTKAQRIPADDLNLMLYGLWRATANNRVLPTPPDGNFTFAGKRYELKREEVSRLQELVGAERRDLAERVMLNDRFAGLPPDRKVALLDRVWSFGARRGDVAFWRERGAGLTPKGLASGFEPSQ